jgi:hypothetical protein
MGYPRLGDYSHAGQLVARTWQVDGNQARRIAELADGLALTHSSLIRLLLGYALDQVDAGLVEIDREPVLYKAVLRR